MNIIAIPARFASTRFPGKLLYPIKGIPLISWVIKRAKMSKLVDKIIVATDDQRIAEVASEEKVDAFLTPSELPSGTDRVAYVVKNVGNDWRYIVNLQGDEPLINPKDIDRIFKELATSNSIVTLRTPITNKEDIENPNVVKVVVDLNNYALYFSRSPIPFERAGKTIYYRHIGIYGYPKDILIKLTSLPQSPLEKTELLEQLRALENGIPIKVLDTIHISYGVDRPEDVETVEKLLEVSEQND
ncbi:MAG: 3-deoxy-manno-octulosonate cytidylyltransferase [Thermosulfidibacteraceae bacterium]|jgi:3-deoxy-manno-octulosonate cytidylyltransferase (CMP-KDO synthetase)